MYIVIDTTNHSVEMFSTHKEAQHFCAMNNRFNWTIKHTNNKQRQSTKRQQAAVKYVEEILYIEFPGDINSFYDCSEFLNLYLDEAKQTERELSCEYESYLDSLD